MKLFLILIFFSNLYKILIWIRNVLYNNKWAKTYSFDNPIISIGNLTAGGTGKTPLVIYLSQKIQKMGKNPGIISRGYGRTSKGKQVVHNGKELLLDVLNAGDEPFLIANTLENIPVVVSENRIEGIKKLIDDFNVDIVIMDDGFQHRKVHRNFDIVTISGNDKKKNYWHLPFGKLREPLKNLDRADIVLITKTENFKLSELHLKILNDLSKKYYITSDIITLMKYDSKGYHKSIIPHEKLFAFCGIGEPSSFLKSVSNLDLKIAGKRIFKDHQKYNERILNQLSLQIRSCDCKSIITTEKDLVKLSDSFLKNFNIYIIKIEIQLKDEKDFLTLVQNIVYN
tara:strand:- start:761 stop:1783 length:1023 start_codon:yes stop_codon:yes gene_type:complete